MERIKQGLAIYQKTKGTKGQPQRMILPHFDESKVTKSSQIESTASASFSTFLSSKKGGLRKVAKFLILLGKEDAVKIVRHLDQSQIESLRREILQVKKIDRVEAEHILKEFGYSLIHQKSGPIVEGKVVAKAILEGIFGKEKAAYVFNKAVPREKPFAFLDNLDPFALRFLIERESVQVLSLVLPYLTKNKAAFVLKHLDSTKVIELVRRLSNLEKVSCEVITRIEKGFHDKIRAYCPVSSQEIDGRALLADILKHMSPDKEEFLLSQLEEANTALGHDIRRRRFTPQDLIHISDDHFEQLLRQRTEYQLALLWKEADEVLRAKIERNISARRMLMVEAELEVLDASQHEKRREMTVFLEEARQGVRNGQADMVNED